MTTFPIIRSVGLSGVLVSFAPTATDAANRAAIAFRGAVDALDLPQIEESSSTLVSAFFRVDLVAYRFDAMRAALAEVLAERDWCDAPLPAGRTLWTVPAVFGGALAPQLEEAAEAAGLSAAEAVADLTGTRLRVLTIGFAPGQPYLGTLAPHWNIPRQVGLSPNVPQGALVAAVQQMCLFAKETPTGWRHVGQSAFRCFQPEAENPFPLSPGDEVQFTSISAAELARLQAHGTDGAVRQVLE
ncbi:MAG: carboxyltransferase domain-containing protein [Pseudomonadota bacterium]